jgi:hypothetical protein
MACTEVKTKKYQSRASPPFHAKDCKNLTKKGKDGDYRSSPDAKGVYKWIKANKTRKVSKGTKIYDVHDNGSRPFRVEVDGKKVSIYRGTRPKGSTNYGSLDYSTLVKTLTVSAIHVGESTCNKSAYLPDACGKWATGNTILLHISGNKYMFVGQEIYEFTMEDDFEAFYSIVGNSDVPYPITLGSKYVYLMLDSDHTYISRDLFKAKMTGTEWADAYAYYYGFKDFETGERINCFDKYRTNLPKRKACEKEHRAILIKRLKGAEKPMKGFKMIQKRGPIK